MRLRDGAFINARYDGGFRTVYCKKSDPVISAILDFERYRFYAHAAKTANVMLFAGLYVSVEANLHSDCIMKSRRTCPRLNKNNASYSLLGHAALLTRPHCAESFCSDLVSHN